MVGKNKQKIELEINDNVFENSDNSDEIIMTEPFDPTQINILPKQDSLSNVIERLRNNEIDMNTEFQRHADLWELSKMSKFIESILIRFPIPAFFFDASDDNNWLIVDGLQRLSSIKKFVIDKKLKLKGLEYLTDFEGHNYDELPRKYQRRINECPITLFIIQPGTPEEVKYSIFRRINTGGLVLNDQEIRNAMAPQSLREYIGKLAQNEHLICTMGDQSKRMIDQELVLRFLAFYSMDYALGTKSIRSFLDEMMKELKKYDRNELNNLEQIFSIALERCWLIFKEEAFVKYNEGNELFSKRKNSTLFEVWTVELANLSEKNFFKLVTKKHEVVKKHRKLMNGDQEYIKSITYSTQKREHFKIRHKKVNDVIQEVLND